MGKFIKTALVFMGGMTAGGYCVVNAALKSSTFTTALKESIAKKAVEVIYGEDSIKPRRRVSYYDAYHNNYETPNRCLTHCNDIVFETRGDAENALVAMTDIIKQYGVVSLADVYDIIGKISPSYAANKYGWRSLDKAKVVRCRAGYFIELPKAEEIK